jgi:hypothetical protein
MGRKDRHNGECEQSRGGMAMIKYGVLLAIGALMGLMRVGADG